MKFALRTLETPRKQLRFDFLFYLGVFLIPFDNLFFAPSTGWAAIAPISFFLFTIANIDHLVLGKTFSGRAFVVVAYCLVLSLLNYFIVGLDFANLIGALSSLILGISFYFALILFYEKGQHSMPKVLKILFWAYLISFVYGVLDRFNVLGFSAIAEALSKRYYPGRLQYTFTEPSFISMHLYGVMLPVILLCKDKYKVRKNVLLFILFLVFSFAFGASARFALDTAVVLLLLAVFFALHLKGGKRVIALIALPVILITGISIALALAPARILRILDLGIYADSSLASRFFRINAIWHGQSGDVRSLLFGYGFSNAYMPFNAGYKAAFAEYRNPYVYEIEGLTDIVTDTFFCLPIRFVAEFGIVGAVLIFVFLFPRKHILLYLLFFFLYIQFDSLAFYTMWLVLFLKRVEKREASRQSQITLALSAIKRCAYSTLSTVTIAANSR